MGCCGKNNEEAVNDDIEQCCAIQGRRCLCLPYDDPWMITAMVLSIVTTLISWVRWPTFIINIVGMAMFQLCWCCRNGFGMIYATVAVALVCCLAHMGVGIYVLVHYKYTIYCEAWTFSGYGSLKPEDNVWDWDDFFYDDRLAYQPTDECWEDVLAAVAFICGIFWAAVAFCVFYFVKSGRHAKWEETYSNEKAAGNGNSTPVVDLEMVETPPQPQPDVDAAPEPSPESEGSAVDKAEVVPKTEKTDEV